jgi:excisionase family DNA binding protein
MRTLDGTTSGINRISGLEPLWTAKDVARFLQCSRDFVYEHAEDGTLPCLRIGGLLRFDPEAVRRWSRGDESVSRVVRFSPRGGR